MKRPTLLLTIPFLLALSGCLQNIARDKDAELISDWEDGACGYKRGFFGPAVIDYQFSRCDQFNEFGLAYIEGGTIHGENESKSALINEEGKIVSDWYDYIGHYERLACRARIKTDSSEQWAMLDTTGKLISGWYKTLYFSDESSYIKATTMDEMEVLLNWNGKEFTKHYQEIKAVGESLSFAEFGDFPDEYYILLSKDGQEISEKFDEIGTFKDGLCPVSKGHHPHGKFGYINTDGKIEIPCQFDYAEDFKDGLAEVQKGRLLDAKKGKINTKGEIVIPIKNKRFIKTYPNMYLVERGFHEFYFVAKTGEDISGPFNIAGGTSSGGFSIKAGLRIGVKIGRSHGDGLGSFTDDRMLVRTYGSNKYGFIDRSGEILIPPTYQDAGKFSQGLAAVKKNGKWGYIDRKGDIVIDFQFDDAKNFSQNLASVKQNEKWGYADKNGKVVIDYQFEKADPFRRGKASVKINGEYKQIDNQGTIIQEQE